MVDIEIPTPRDDEVLIKVHVTGVNSWDWENLRWRPSMVPLGKRSDPRYKILGADVAGTIEAIGKEVKRFKPGDEVFGDLCESGWGGFAEYVCAREDALALKPASMTFEEAATIPQAGQMAIQGIRFIGQVRPGQRVLINGAGGGVGTFAVQIAKSLGAEVTGVDSAGKFEMLRSIGADHVVDYKKEDYTKRGQRYDLILDMKGCHSILGYRRSLRPGGKFVIVGGTWGNIFKILLLGPLISMVGSRKMKILFLKPNRDLESLIALFEAGTLVTVIDRRYPLSEVPEALRYIEEGRVKGKLVITMDVSQKPNKTQHRDDVSQ